MPPGSVYHQCWLAKGPELRNTLIVRRDPVDRFISGYRNFRDKRGLKLGFSEFFERFPQLYQCNSEVYHHFRPQSSYYPGRPIETFDHVIDFHDFANLKRLFERMAVRVLPDIRLQRAEYSDFEVHEWQAEVIAAFYRCGYQAGFGEPDSWRKDIADS